MCISDRVTQNSMQLSNYLTKNYTLGKVEFEGETPDAHSFCTHERHRVDRDVTTSSETRSYQKSANALPIIHSRNKYTKVVLVPRAKRSTRKEN